MLTREGVLVWVDEILLEEILSYQLLTFIHRVYILQSLWNLKQVVVVGINDLNLWHDATG